MLYKQGLTIILSGSLPNSTSFDLAEFWKCFIQVQRSIPQTLNVDNILAHSFSVNQHELIKLVYNPNVFIEEKPPSPQKNILMAASLNNSQDGKNNFLKPKTSHSDLKHLILDITSRSKALNLLTKIPNEETSKRVLILDWTALTYRKKNTREICVDASLPEDYVYMEYNKNIDFGYYDDWIFTSWNLAKEFISFEDFSTAFVKKRCAGALDLESIEWPWGYNQSVLRSLFFIEKLTDITSSVKKYAFAVHRRFVHRDFFSRVFYKLATLLLTILDGPIISAETSFLAHPQFSLKTRKIVSGKIDRSKLAKAFVASKPLIKDNLRLLTANDFKLTSVSGQLIAPQKIILIVDLDIGQSKDNFLKNIEGFLLPLKKVFIIKRHKIFEITIGKRGKVEKQKILNILELRLDKKLMLIRDRIGAPSNKSLPIVFLNSFSEQNFCDDWSYLNALLKFFVFTNKRLVLFSDSVYGKRVKEFPFLKSVKKPQELSLQNMVLSSLFFAYMAESISDSGKFKVSELRPAQNFCSISGKQIFTGI